VLVIPVAMAWSAFGPAFPIYYTCGFFAATHALSLLVAFSAAHLLVSAVAAAVEMMPPREAPCAGQAPMQDTTQQESRGESSPARSGG